MNSDRTWMLRIRKRLFKPLLIGGRNKREGVARRKNNERLSNGTQTNNKYVSCQSGFSTITQSNLSQTEMVHSTYCIQKNTKMLRLICEHPNFKKVVIKKDRKQTLNCRRNKTIFKKQ